jgi:3-deoxy-D-manno-octulosonic-acid transferase
MPVLYDLGITAYSTGAKILAIWNDKARKWVVGRKGIFEHIENTLPKKENKKRIWMHVASLGEFEQGLPLLEKFNRDEWDIVTTFFSPSGFEHRKNHAGIDKAYYLPKDTYKNARRFLDLVQPDVVVFVKYDFWYYYLQEIKQREIPLYLVSALFRAEQRFFKKNSKLHQKMLFSFNHIFTQNQESVEMLAGIGYTQATYVGDTRCDRVLENAKLPQNNGVIAAFKGKNKLLIAGSSWPEEEIMLAKVLPDFKELSLVIAPHDISEKHLKEIEAKFDKTIRYSKLKEESCSFYKVVIIDNIGMLSSLYQYGDIAMIGGAFRKGLHNILEAAVFGIPVIYGTPINKYPEGKRLAQAGGGFMVDTQQQLQQTLNNLLNDESYRQTAGEKAKQFILSNAGASEKIFKFINSDD